MAYVYAQLVFIMPPSSGLFRSVIDSMWNRLLTRAIPFNPVDFALPADFRLTGLHNYTSQLDWRMHRLECSLKQLEDGSYQATCTAQIFMVLDDPFIYGQIAAVAIMSELYALGILAADTIVPVVEVGLGLSDHDSITLASMHLTGFSSAMRHLTGNAGHGLPYIARCAFSSVGGTVIGTSRTFVPASNARPGDLLVLTKPLGATFVLALYQSMMARDADWRRVEGIVTERVVHRLYQTALDLMRLPERDAARLMQKYGAHAATHVGKRGLVGHATALVLSQSQAVDFSLSTVPVISRLAELAIALGDPSQLLEGLAPEVSAGLLVCLPPSAAFAFVAELNEREGVRATVIGRVVKGTRAVSFYRNLTKSVQVGPF
uniref:PurM-like C-terminal domain-containing protein n=1 Tax=Anopheles dirus TaxID=7168 RepID=A0A182N8E5_9DIPT